MGVALGVSEMAVCVDVAGGVELDVEPGLGVLVTVASGLTVA